MPDPFPDDCDGHGTHVSGIIGANGDIRGVAPEVTFHAYRVFGCEGPTTADIMLAAMELTLANRADVLNISIGGAFQWPQYPTAQAANRLVRRGVAVVAAIGNEGSFGLYSAAAPGVGRDVSGVASFDNTHLNLPAFTVSPDDLPIGYQNASGAPLAPLAGSSPILATGNPASADDACTPLPADSLSGRVALIRRGTCSFYQKSFNAQQAGADGVVIYNNVAGRVAATVAGVPPITIPVVTITAFDGGLIHSRLPAELTWTERIVSDPIPTGGLISSFSSWGLAADLSVKPDLGAPGGLVVRRCRSSRARLVSSAEPSVRRLLQISSTELRRGWFHRKRGHRHDDRREVTFTLGHEPAIATGANTFAPTFFAAFATVDFSSPTVSIGDRRRAGDAWIVVSFTRPTIPVAKLFGGYITLTPDDGGPVLRVPYAGYNGDYQEIVALTPTPAGLPWLAKLVPPALVNQPNGAVFTLEGTDLPFIVLHLDHQVQRLKMEVIDVASGRSFNFATDDAHLGRNATATSAFLFAWDGTTTKRPGGRPRPVPNGTYRLEMSVLKALGDPGNPAHTEVWTSPPITIARP